MVAGQQTRRRIGVEIEKREIGLAGDPPAARRRARIDRGELAADRHAAGGHPGSRRGQARRDETFREADQVCKARGEAEKSHRVLRRGVPLDDLTLGKTVEPGDFGEIGAGIAHLDLVQSVLARGIASVAAPHERVEERCRRLDARPQNHQNRRGARDQVLYFRKSQARQPPMERSGREISFGQIRPGRLPQERPITGPAPCRPITHSFPSLPPFPAPMLWSASVNTRVIVAVVGVVTLLLGLGGLFRPEWVMNFVGYAVASNAPATLVRGEVRAVYGGLMVAAGVLTLLAAPAPRANQGKL